MSAASLATSVPVSTEIPTSAWCSATASFTPSPMNATSAPRTRCTRTIRDFVSGPDAREHRRRVDRVAERVVVHRVDLFAGQRRRARRGRGRVHTLTATCGLSPVMTFTTMPSRASRASDGAASAFGPVVNTRKPTKPRCCSSASVGAVEAGRDPGRDRDHPRARVVEIRERLRPRRAARRRCARARLRARPSPPASGRRRARRRRRPTRAARGRTGGARRASSRGPRPRGSSSAASQSATSSALPLTGLPGVEHGLVAHEPEEVRARDRRAAPGRPRGRR